MYFTFFCARVSDEEYDFQFCLFAAAALDTGALLLLLLLLYCTESASFSTFRRIPRGLGDINKRIQIINIVLCYCALLCLSILSRIVPVIRRPDSLSKGKRHINFNVSVKK